jgi:predicted amidophosphoribosyltransferase
MVRAGTTGGNEAILWALARHCALRLGGLRADRVAAVPVSPWRRLPAGLNPADLLAHTFAAHRGLPLFHPLARRRSAPVGSRPGGPVRGRVPLAGSAFRRVCPVEGRVLLVTDALTTGSTARACAEELLRAGASAVDLLAIAADPCGMAREC